MVTIRGRHFHDRDIQLIKRIVTNNPSLSRRGLSFKICEKLEWRQPNGRTKDRACRDALLKLQREGIIQLPHPKWHAENKGIRIRAVSFVEPSYRLSGTVGQHGEPQFEEVRTKSEHRLWNYLVERYHYLGCKFIVGHHLKYFLHLNGHLVGCLAYSDGVLHLGKRDKWIGWNKRQQERNLHLVINNRRFVLFPWASVKYLASKVLSCSAKIVPASWENRYGYRPVLMESFIAKKRFAAICYRAANWIYLGDTIGKGRKGNRYFDHGIIKRIYVYPLEKGARDIFRSEGLNDNHIRGYRC